MEQVLSFSQEFKLYGLNAGEEKVNVILSLDPSPPDDLPFTVNLIWISIDGEREKVRAEDCFQLTLLEAKEMMHALRHQIAALERANASGA